MGLDHDRLCTIIKSSTEDPNVKDAALRQLARWVNPEVRSYYLEVVLETFNNPANWEWINKDTSTVLHELTSKLPTLS
ncbi:MAG: hypothetical protein R3B38_01070 [Patescibacteria group bacterium]